MPACASKQDVLELATLRYVYTVWNYQLWSFKSKDTKLERFSRKNQHTLRKLLNLQNWTNGEHQQLAKIKVYKVDYFDF